MWSLTLDQYATAPNQHIKYCNNKHLILQQSNLLNNNLPETNCCKGNKMENVGHDYILG